jgi:hypothetical protein
MKDRNLRRERRSRGGRWEESPGKQVGERGGMGNNGDDKPVRRCLSPDRGRFGPEGQPPKDSSRLNATLQPPISFSYLLASQDTALLSDLVSLIVFKPQFADSLLKTRVPPGHVVYLNVRLPAIIISQV